MSRQIRAETQVLPWKFGHYLVRDTALFVMWVESRRCEVRKVVLKALGKEDRMKVEKWFREKR